MSLKTYDESEIKNKNVIDITEMFHKGFIFNLNINKTRIYQPMITNIYNYPELIRKDKDIGRFYIDSNENLVPSVTTVLSRTSKKSNSIKEWRNRVGEEEADRITKQSTDIGSMVHEALENYLYGKDWENFTDDNDGMMAKKITQKFIEVGLNSISEVWGLEVGLILDGLYAGTADCIGKINGISTIIDFKTARRIKKREWIEDYFLQCCAYANAHNVMFGTQINQATILMVDRDLIFREFTVNPKEFDHLTKLWKRRLIEFHKKFNNDIS